MERRGEVLREGINLKKFTRFAKERIRLRFKCRLTNIYKIRNGLR